MVLAAGLWLVGACGGASSQDVFDPNATASSSGTSGTSGASSGTSGGASSGTSGTSGTPDGSVVDAADPCPPETEPNNSKETANTLSPTLCGVISPDGESDFLTFQLKPASTSLAITFTGQVTLKVTVAGNSVTLSGTSNVKVPFVKGQRYIIEVKAAGGAPNIPWRVDLIEK
ncbi:hypothetical protein BH11MYX4_BH11MYX4_51780 [soil metagenome]